MIKYYLSIFAITLNILCANKLTGQNADTILYKMDKLMTAAKDREATVRMILTDKNGKVKERVAHMLQKGMDRKMYRYTWPEDQAGIATLSLPDDVMWLWMPAFEDPVKISLLAKSQAFTGTDFSYEDMESRTFTERYKPKLLDSGNENVYLLELIPDSGRSKYSKILAYIDKASFYPHKMEYFNNRGDLFKQATYVYKKQGKYWYAEEVLMEDLKKEHSTKVILSDVKFDQGLTDDLFTVEKLQGKE